jgi:hypothetical protein
MKPNQKRLLGDIPLLLVAVPVLGIFFGGVYSLPAMYVTKERDPWLTLLLGIGLALTVFGIGLPTQMPPLYLAAVWLASIVLLLAARAAHGSLGHNLERFGKVHAVTLGLTLLVVAITRHVTRTNGW